MRITAKDDRLLVLSTLFATKIANGEAGNGFSKKPITDVDFIAGAVNVGGVHWTLLFVDVIKKRVIYIDPFGTSETSLQNIGDNWVTFANSQLSLKGYSWKFQQVDHDKQDRKKDSFNCGVYVCTFFSMLYTAIFGDEEVSQLLLQKDITLVRREVAAFILNHD